jgi:magnesium transporter
VSSAAAAIRTRLWRSGELVEENFPFDKISEYLAQDDCLIWVDLCDPEHHLLNELAGELSLHPAAVEDAISHHERAKASRYSTHTFLTAYATTIRSKQSAPADTSDNSGDLQLHRVSAFVLPRAVVTVRHSNGFDMDDVVARWDNNADLMKYGLGALTYGLLDYIVDSHFTAVQALDDSIEDLEDVLFDDRAPSKEIQRQTYQVRKDLVELRRVVLPMRELVNAVLRHRQDREAAVEMDAFYADLYDHVLRASEWTESLRDMVSAIFETNLSLQDARLNTVMKKLTSWAAIIAVPTAVTGYFGQNVPYPGFGQPLGLWLSLGVMLGMAIGLYATFKRREWL